ncbi:hypothetical protein ACIBI4_01605 [Streptomyces sp. NPDC050418]
MLRKRSARPVAAHATPYATRLYPARHRPRPSAVGKIDVNREARVVLLDR